MKAMYRAKRYRIQQKVALADLGLDNWVIARSWGRGGRGTIGWSGVQPMDGESNVQGNPSGWCRVIGDAMPGDTNFNEYNIKDISYRNDIITLETYCFQVYDKLNGDTCLGWFPVPPDSVVYRYTVWGKLSDTTVGIKENIITESPYNIKCDVRVSNENTIQINYSINHLGKVELYIYDCLGKPVYTDYKDSGFDYGRNRFNVKMENMQSGAYYVLIKSGVNYGFCNFVLIK
jgi:hypothetical protein